MGNVFSVIADASERLYDTCYPKSRQVYIFILKVVETIHIFPVPNCSFDLLISKMVKSDIRFSALYGMSSRFKNVGRNRQSH